MRRVRVLGVAAVALAVLAVAGTFAVFLLRGGDEPPPPRLSTATPGAATPQATAPAGEEAWQVAGGEPTFVGYRVREEFASVGVVDAVGRTGEVTGSARVDGDRVLGAELEADMTTLRSDESRRDNALRERGIET